jgi:electron transfer flavoprotein alpha subunit
MHIGVLVKQVPRFEELELGPDGRLRRDGIEPEMNPYCRRAVSQAVALAATQPDATIAVFTLGPESAADVLREAIAWGLARAVAIEGVLVSDPAFAGSDTLATARALAAAVEREAPFDLVLTGRNSVDADTGQVPAELAELLGLPFLTGVRHLAIEGTVVHARCEHDDGWMQAEVVLPAVLSCAERLIEPAKVDLAGRAGVPSGRIRRVTAADLGPGPWGKEASPTWVGPVKTLATARARACRPEAPLAEQVHEAARVLRARGALTRSQPDSGMVAAPRTHAPMTLVVAEPDRARMTRELLGAAAALTGNVLVVTLDAPDGGELVSWGANEIVRLDGENVEADVARAVVRLAERERPAIILAPSTAWGREVASRVAARLGAGLTGDAVELEADEGFRLTAWKPAFGGQLVAAIGCTSQPQMATVRAGVLPALVPRPGPAEWAHQTVALEGASGVRVLARTRDDDLDVLAEAAAVIGVGTGVPPDSYRELEPLRRALGAELAATRKVTDNGWLPRARQVGITGRAIAPRLYVSIGASGKFNHMVGVRGAGTVLAINPDASAPVFDHSDIGIVGDWRAAVPLLVEALTT